MYRDKIYLGDSVYVEFSGHDLLLYTDNGLGPKDKIYIGQREISALFEFAKAKGVMFAEEAANED